MSRIVLVSNRVPARNAGGAQAGGLAVALNSLLKTQGGLWFGWSGAVCSTPAATPRQTTDGRITYATVDLSHSEYDGYYNGYSNAVLWPLLHMLPSFEKVYSNYASAYMMVNRRFAAALAPMLKCDDVIWVQDYHLLALPAALRALGVRSPVAVFLHTPFPSAAAIMSVPFADEAMKGVLEADLIGFQTEQDREHFASFAESRFGARRGSVNMLRHEGRMIRVGVFPVEIDATEFAAAAGRAGSGRAAGEFAASLLGRALILGVDRLDPTKGLPERFDSFRKLLQQKQEWQGAVTFLQIAAVSRGDVGTYRSLRRNLEGKAGGINAEFGRPDWTPMRLVTACQPRDAVAGYMRKARVGLVTPLRDGMNLVAKEYVAAQDPADPGVLVLSRFAGAAQQLAAALLVNPDDPEEIAEALDAALRMNRTERRRRWQDLWGVIADKSAVKWGLGVLAATPGFAAAATGREQAIRNGSDMEIPHYPQRVVVSLHDRLAG